MENALDEIAQGKLDELAFLKSFYEGDEGLDQQVRSNKAKINSKDIKKLDIPQLSEENCIYLGPYGPYVRDDEGKFISIPEDWTPAVVTDEKIRQLKANGNQKSETKSNVPEKIGETEDGQPILYCTGKFGDYWQVGDRAKTEDIRRFKVPKEHIGNRNISAEAVMRYFALPRTVGTNANGETITADIGKYGPYIKCGSDFRSIKSSNDLFTITEEDARAILETPKESTRSSSSRAKASGQKKESSSQAVVDFGEHEGKSLGIFRGRYGYYLKYGKDNIGLPKEYKQDEAACKAMTREAAIALLG